MGIIQENSSQEDLATLELFRYQKPSQEQVSRIEDTRAAIQYAASQVLANCKPSRGRSLAITKLQEAMMHASASVVFEWLTHPEVSSNTEPASSESE